MSPPISALDPLEVHLQTMQTWTLVWPEDSGAAGRLQWASCPNLPAPIISVRVHTATMNSGSISMVCDVAKVKEPQGLSWDLTAGALIPAPCSPWDLA